MIDRIGNKATCTGCTACYAVCTHGAISMVPDDKGFIYPVIDQTKCIHCTLCQKTCPLGNKQLQNGDNIEAFAVKHRSTEVRKQSTSGGFFTALSDYVLSQHGCVFGAVFGDKMEVLHVKAENSLQRNAMRGAKYVQSSLNNAFVAVHNELRTGRLVLFTGTPCQCAGLKAYLHRDWDNLILCEVFCHSVHSPKIFSDYIQMMEKKLRSPVVRFASREKRYGWTRRDHVTVQNGKEDDSSIQSAGMHHLYNMNLGTRPSCEHCPFGGTARVSDFAMGDCWGINHFAPEMRDAMGVSLVVATTDKAKETLKKLNSIIIRQVDYAIAISCNHHTPVTINKLNDEMWTDYANNGYNYVYKKYVLHKNFAHAVKHRIRCLKRRRR